MNGEQWGNMEKFHEVWHSYMKNGFSEWKKVLIWLKNIGKTDTMDNRAEGSLIREYYVSEVGNMKRDKLFQIWMSLTVLTIVLIFSLVFYIKSLNQGFGTEVVQSLQEVSGQGAVAVQTEIDGKMNLLKGLAAVLDVPAEADGEELIGRIEAEMNPIVEDNGFLSMGLILSDGMTYTTKGAIYDSSGQEFFQSAMEGETRISGRIPLSTEEGYANVYSTPIFDRATGRPKAVLIAIYRTENFRSTLEVTSFNGEGYSYMVTDTGDVVVDSAHQTAFQDMSNVYLSIQNADESNSQCIEQLQYYMSRQQSGVVIFRNKVDKYMYCTPAGFNDWYLLTVVPVRIMDRQMNQVIRNTVVLIVVLLAVFFGLVWLILQQQKKRQEELMNLAYVDPITGGYTYVKFQQIFEGTVQNNPNLKFALLTLDLNKFKLINDLYGYDEGDRIIRNMDGIWKNQFRMYECCGHRMADRFVVLLTYETKEELEQRIRNYRKQLQEASSGGYKLSLRVGIYMLEHADETFSTVFNRSMMAFAAAKEMGNHFFAFYNSQMEEQLVWEQYVEDYFSTALKNREFVVYYQAKISAETGEVSGAEALVRWIRPDGTIIPPSRFISVLENNGTIAELDRYMFREVCLRQKAWLEEGRKIVPVSVNLSRVQLAERNFVDTYAEILEASGLPSRYIALEFTESAMFDNEEILRDTVDQLHALGIKVLIDDFGVGYSSMMTLKVIPVDILKMDKSFIDTIGDERSDKIVVGMIEFALSLGMSVTAEGVENDQQYKFLRSHRCDDIQGYFFSVPVPAREYCDKFLICAQS